MRKLILLFSLVCFALMAGAQGVLTPFADWSSTTGSQNFFYKNITKTDASGAIYVAGATMNGYGNYDILLVKYNAAGTAQWTVQYDGTGNGQDMATGLYIDGSGNVYITGLTTTSTSVDIITIKYNSSGTQQWLRTYDGTGSGYDSGADVTVDTNGDVYITGSSYNATPNTDVLTIKYDSSGTQQWVSRYNYTANLNDAGFKISVTSTYVAVTGIVQSSSTNYKWCLITFNKSTGAYINMRIDASGASTGIDQVNDMVKDASGNIYVVGARPVTGQGYDIDIIKFNSTMSLAWERTYDGGSSLDDIGKGIVVDGSGNVYVTGYTTTTSHGKDIMTIKYNSSGTQQWVNTFDDANHGNDEGAEMAIDNSGNIYVTGYITTAMDNADYYTIKYNSSGTEIWNIHSDGTAHLNDKAVNIAIDNYGSIVITGESEKSSGNYEYMTVKYVQKTIITPTDYNGESPQNSFSYYQNKGQLINTTDSLVPNIKYYEKNSSPEYYIQDTSFSFVFARIDTIPATNDTLHRIDVTFDKVNTGAKAYSLEEQPDYLNYFLGHCPNGITDIPRNMRVVTTSLYSNIDLMYSSNQNGIKYYFIVKPGGNPADIGLIFTGATSFNLDGTTNALTINSSIGSLTFERPTVYQLTSNNVIDPITGWTADWVQNGATNKYKFYIGSYNTSEALIIQVDCGHATHQLTPVANVDWSTYFGGSQEDVGVDITTNVNGSVFVTGYTLSSNFPAYYGMYISPFGNDDIIIGKFNKDAVPKWVTYFGGSQIDRGHGIVCNGKYVYVTGETTSNNFPHKNPGGSAFIDSTYGGVCDAFVLRIDTTDATSIASCDWSTYFGSCADTKAMAIDADNNGNICIVGETWEGNCSAGSLFPLVNPGGNAYFQNTYGGGGVNTYDGFIAKFTNGNHLNWSTLIGGTNDDDINDITINKQTGEIFISGSTYSSGTVLSTPCLAANNNSFPLCDPGNNAYVQSYNGIPTAIIARFASNGNLLWSSFFGGHTVTLGTGIAINSLGDVYMTGTVRASGWTDTTTMISNIACAVPTNQGFPTCNPWQKYAKAPYTFREDVYLSRFNSSNQLTWSTFYGGRTSERGNFPYVITFTPKIACDQYNNIFVTGTSKKAGIAGYNDFPVMTHTNYYNQDSIKGSFSILSKDAFMLWFNPLNQLRWATLFGGNDSIQAGNDIAANIAVHGNYVYITGSAASYNFPYACPPNISGTPFCVGTYGGGSTDAFISRFDLLGDQAGIHEDEPVSGEFSVYPNPAMDQVTLQLNAEGIRSFKIAVYNVMGQVLYNTDISNASMPFTKNINIRDYSRGMYLVIITSAYKTISSRIIKL